MSFLIIINRSLTVRYKISIGLALTDLDSAAFRINTHDMIMTDLRAGKPLNSIVCPVCLNRTD